MAASRKTDKKKRGGWRDLHWLISALSAKENEKENGQNKGEVRLRIGGGSAGDAM